MKKKKISLRTATGWRVVENAGKFRCDRCGARLWKGPGNSTYCNAEHSDVSAQTLGQHGLEHDDFRATREDIEVHPSV